MKKVIKVVKNVFDVLSWILIAVLVASVIISMIAKINGTAPSVFGYSVYRVSSGSMEPELMVGDVILGKKVDDPMTIKEGDIVTYKGSGSLKGKLITHKVIVAPVENNGVISLQTKGVANNVPDAPITADRVVSVVVKEVAFLTAFYNFFFSPWGLLSLIALIILVFIDELIAMVKTLAGLDTPKRKDKADINDIIDRIKTDTSEDTDSLSEDEDAMDQLPDGESTDNI